MTEHIAMAGAYVCCVCALTIDAPHRVGTNVNAHIDVAHTGHPDASGTDTLSGDSTRVDKRTQQGQQEAERRQ